MLCWISAEGTTYQEFPSRNQSPANEQTPGAEQRCEIQPHVVPELHPTPGTVALLGDTAVPSSPDRDSQAPFHSGTAGGVVKTWSVMQTPKTDPEGRNQSSFSSRKRPSQIFSSELCLSPSTFFFFLLKILLSAEEADQERETRVAQISQYCQISAMLH